ncbi:MAG: hypothetical protein JRH18_18820 [Deltaproteobacteria bacterium]|nr:hypothetical protein [Deltaproteobacteria bacterium]MBW1962066.1 hypothetical protein [Deltaproteobacteria bacterium]MBW2153708.1 hypothetical protein [Deltaproteobacteria bacterium]
MASEKNQDSSQRFTLRIVGLAIAEEEKIKLENAADDLAGKVDAAGYLDPLDEGPATVFDPRS